MKKRLRAIEILFLLISVLLLCGCAEFENATRSSIPSTDSTPTEAPATPGVTGDVEQTEITPTDTIAPRAIEEITATPVPTNTPTPTAYTGVDSDCYTYPRTDSNRDPGSY